MPHHLMNLRHVPDDEAEEIRSLFEAHDVRYYETPPSRWGISMGGFWVHDSEEAERAKVILHEYQCQRMQSQRDAYEALRLQGKTGLWYMFRRKPVRTLAACLAIIVITGISLLPFVRIG